MLEVVVVCTGVPSPKFHSNVSQSWNWYCHALAVRVTVSFATQFAPAPPALLQPLVAPLYVTERKPAGAMQEPPPVLPPSPGS